MLQTEWSGVGWLMAGVGGHSTDINKHEHNTPTRTHAVTTHMQTRAPWHTAAYTTSPSIYPSVVCASGALALHTRAQPQPPPTTNLTVCCHRWLSTPRQWQTALLPPPLKARGPPRRCGASSTSSQSAPCCGCCLTTTAPPPRPGATTPTWSWQCARLRTSALATLSLPTCASCRPSPPGQSVSRLAG